PFDDGNGRTSRIVQNVILLDNGYPLPIVKEGERVFYSELVHNALRGWRNRNVKLETNDINELLNVSKDEGIFFDYIASRINLSMDCIIESSKIYKE
ncbi:MAG: hypothetical protein KJ623_00570, partial [Nanoarchaeota archaeon]|nr:hypothetical protein [Nanoarchaeota archaeon]